MNRRLRIAARLLPLALEVGGVLIVVLAVAQWTRPLALLLLGVCLVIAALALQKGGVV